MYCNNKIIVGKSNGKELGILLDKANRHGLITGSSGSGKTITLKVMAESFSDAGIPVFLADVKGDLAGCPLKGEENDNIKTRLQKLNIDNFEYKSFPVHFWDIYGNNGYPIRTKIQDIGPQILSIMLGLSEIQEGVLTICFKIAQDEKLDLIDLKDLKSALQYIGDHRNNYITKYGNINSGTIGVIQRSILTLENQGADNFFGEPEIDIKDFIQKNDDKQGYINILDAVELFKNPDLYASFLLWILTEIFNKMPEVGDIEKPKLIFFFDEAHLLFNDMPKYRLKQITQIVKLIRSRAVGIYFISQNPHDIPDEIISQLGNRVQHNLRAYTPSEQKLVKAASDAFRQNPNFKTDEAILNLGTGEALISFQNEKGEPEIVEKATILPPQSKMGTIDDMTRLKIINNGLLAGKYDEKQDNESAHEIINAKYEQELKVKDEKEQAKKLAIEKKKSEKARKNNPAYKLGKKIVNKSVDKVINKSLNKIMKNLFK